MFARQVPPQLADLREHYLRHYRQYLAEHGPRIGDLSPEALVLVAGPAAADEVPESHRLFRPDAVWRGPDGQPVVARIDAPSPPL